MSMIFSLRNILVKILLIVSFGELSLAETTLPISNKTSDTELPISNKKSEVNLPKSNKKEESSQDSTLQISLDMAEPSTSSKLKKGKGCVSIKGLKEAKGEEFIDFPMAETIPCDEVDCKNLEKAVLHDDKYQDLPEAESMESCEE